MDVIAFDFPVRMNERLLQFIWQHQHFNYAALCTEEGDALEIVDRGTYNTNQGPDFTAAKVRINDTTWIGHIELHVLASDWGRHNHDADPNFTNIILHVVWRNDLNQRPASIRNLPLLELEPRVSKLLLGRYEEMMNFRQFIPCEKYLPFVNTGLWSSWQEELLIHRLSRRADHIYMLLKENNYHWEETFWWMIARNFGGSINGDAFEEIARSVPLNILGRHKDQLIQLEAIIFGQASLLSRRFTEAYPVMLQKEYRFLQKKYQLKRKTVSLKFLRMRPVAFPTVRLAQLAALIHQSVHLFSKVCESNGVEEVRKVLEVTANDYWHYHFRFEESSALIRKTLGRNMTDSLLINTVIPMVYAFGMYKSVTALQEKAVGWLGRIAAEKNNITRCWEKSQVKASDAFATQALIELKTNYCDVRRCLECRIGESLLGAERKVT